MRLHSTTIALAAVALSLASVASGYLVVTRSHASEGDEAAATSNCGRHDDRRAAAAVVRDVSMAEQIVSGTVVDAGCFVIHAGFCPAHTSCWTSCGSGMRYGLVEDTTRRLYVLAADEERLSGKLGDRVAVLGRIGHEATPLRLSRTVPGRTRQVTIEATGGYDTLEIGRLL